jgi:hypothetical protein
LRSHDITFPKGTGHQAAADPLLAQMAAFGYKYLLVLEELGIGAKLLSNGGPTIFWPR